MPKYLEFHHEGTSREEVYNAYHYEMDARMKERYHAILLGMDGWTCPEIAEVLYRDADTIRAYARAFRAGGLAGLTMDHSSGRPPQLGSQDKEELKKVLRQSPREAGYERNVWTVGMVVDWLRRERGIELQGERVRQILQELEFRMRQPRLRHRQRSQEACESWVIDFVCELLELIDQGSRPVGLIFFDEAGVQLEPTLVRRWTYVGEDACAEDEYVVWSQPSQKAERGNVQMHVGVHPACGPDDPPRVHFRVLPVKQATDGEQVKKTIQMFHVRYAEERLWVVMDNAKVHRLGAFARWAEEPEQKAWLKVTYLPDYAPDLNLAEDIWKVMRPMVTHNYSHGTVQKLRQAAQAACAKLRGLGKKLASTANLDRFFSLLDCLFGKEFLEKHNVYHPVYNT